MLFRGVGWQAVLRRAAGVAAAAALLSSCGGGGQQVERFQPTRLIAFGDDASVIEDDNNDGNGRKYSVNWANAASAPNPQTRDCKQLPIWIQSLATAFGLTFSQCNPDSTATPNALTLAQPNADSAAVKTQIDQFLADGNSFGGKDLVTILAGTNDIVAMCERIGPGYTVDQAMVEAQAAGTALSAQVNRVAQAGGKVLISTIPDLGDTPYGKASPACSPMRDANGCGTVGSCLSDRFNSKLRVGLINDGRMIGLITMDQTVQLIINAGSLVSADTACASTPAVPDCTTLTLNTTTTTTMPTAPTPATVTSWLWSDAKRLGPGGHAALGSAAVTRASNNPF